MSEMYEIYHSLSILTEQKYQPIIKEMLNVQKKKASTITTTFFYNMLAKRLPVEVFSQQDQIIIIHAAPLCATASSHFQQEVKNNFIFLSYINYL